MSVCQILRGPEAGADLLGGVLAEHGDGTNLAVLLPPIGLAVTVEYYRHRNVDVRAATILVATVFVGA